MPDNVIRPIISDTVSVNLIRRLRGTLLQPVENRDISGHWRGKVIDVMGLQGDMQLMIETEGEAVVGRFSASVALSHGIATLEGKVTGKTSGDTVELDYHGPAEMRFHLSGDVVPIAGQKEGLSIVGCYEVNVDSKRATMFRAGSIVLRRG